jgi:Arc/MetJ-type ribon-helix-helix transcriptional regulator
MNPGRRIRRRGGAMRALATQTRKTGCGERRRSLGPARKGRYVRVEPGGSPGCGVAIPNGCQRCSVQKVGTRVSHDHPGRLRPDFAENGLESPLSLRGQAASKRVASCALRIVHRHAAHEILPISRATPTSCQPGMLTYMQRTTVKLPDDLDARLRHEAERRGTTVSELTRQAIEALLGQPRGRRRLLAAGAGASGRSDISEQIEQILASEVGSSR